MRIKSDQKEVKASREAALRGLYKTACSCWRKIIDEEEALAAPQLGKPSNLASCAYSSCPPGYSCKDKVCYLNAPRTAEAKSFIKDQVSDLGRDVALEQVMKSIGVSAKVAGGMTAYLLQFLSPLSGNDSIEGYSRNLGRYEVQLQKLQGYSVELANFSSGKPARGGAQIRNDIARFIPELLKSYDTLSSLAKDVIIEQQISAERCPEVFEGRVRKISELHSKMVEFATTISKP